MWVKLVEIPQLQFLGMPVVVQRQMAMVLTVQTPSEIPLLQALDKVDGMPIVVQRQVRTVPTVQENLRGCRGSTVADLGQSFLTCPLLWSFQFCISWSTLLTCPLFVQ